MPEKKTAPKCANHEDREATVYDMGGAIKPIALCEECTPAWFSDDDKAKAE